MTENNDYRTPRDRISNDFRNKLFADNSEETLETFLGINENRNCQCNRTKEADQREYCGCEKKRFGANNTWSSTLPLAMVYSPFQKFENLYCEEEALEKGSLFSDLYLPFEAFCCGQKRFVQNGGFKR